MLPPSRVALLSLLAVTVAPLACGSSKGSGYSASSGTTCINGVCSEPPPQ